MGSRRNYFVDGTVYAGSFVYFLCKDGVPISPILQGFDTDFRLDYQYSMSVARYRFGEWVSQRVFHELKMETEDRDRAVDLGGSWEKKLNRMILAEQRRYSAIVYGFSNTWSARRVIEGVTGVRVESYKIGQFIFGPRGGVNFVEKE